jgi:hypothetical protein
MNRNTRRRPVPKTQDELESLVLSKFGHLSGYDGMETVFADAETPARPPNTISDLAEYAKTFCVPPQPPVWIEDLRSDISGFLKLYRLDHCAPLIARTTDRISARLDMPEVYALALAFVTVAAGEMQNEAGMRDAAFVCARHLGAGYTGMVRGVLDFDVWQRILSEKNKRLLELYLDVLEREFGGLIPPEWLYTKQ